MENRVINGLRIPLVPHDILIIDQLQRAIILHEAVYGLNDGFRRGPRTDIDVMGHDAAVDLVT